VVALDRFVDHVNALGSPHVLELGTRKWGEASTHHQALFPKARYVMTDFIDGDDVDVVSDVHNLDEFESVTFDAVFSASTFEHIQYPWIAAMTLHRVIKPRGVLFVQTHQTFPVHGYPSDYTRWTDMGLRSLFEWAGFEVAFADMTEPCVIQRPDNYPVWDYNAKAFIAVSVFAVKPK
jgi:SAM-dependent methyltransferase